MSQLSIIIVNYNVQYFLEQCLLSVKEAIKNIDAEVWVVDNNSTDGSIDLVNQKFDWVNLIANQDNRGFSKANNQAIQKANGKYVLLLNPDTIVEENTFEQCIDYLENNSDVGGLGVQMIDGTGNFLPESKRALPTPMVALFKLSGLSNIFPKSKLFGKYHLGFLAKEEIHEIEVLSGAYMMMPKSVLDEIGLLDEDYFMYGEDIDLSYRITKAGYKNIYFPNARIIHYKGESTKKGSLNYVKVFYKAMAIFARKHFSQGQAGLYSFFISLAIAGSAVLVLLKNIVRHLFLPFVDAVFLLGGLLIAINLWETEVKGFEYPKELLLINIPIYIVIWLLSIFFSGGNDRPYKYQKVFRGLVMGTIIIAAVYGFLNEEYRFSRALIVLGAMWASVSTFITRMFVRRFSLGAWTVEGNENNRVIIAGSPEEVTRVLGLLNASSVNTNYLGFVSNTANENDENYLGRPNQLEDIVSVYKVKEIIFCAKDIAANTIINIMSDIKGQINYKVMPEKGLGIIGSNSKDTSGDLYGIDINLAIASPGNRRNKRLLDIVLCFILLIISPILLFVSGAKFFPNWINVLLGKKTWVGFDEASNSPYHLPEIKKGILSPSSVSKGIEISSSTIARLNLLYARDYSIYKDIELIYTNLSNLGR